MRILISNDDGVYAPGLAVLADCLKTVGDVVVVAPDRNRSGVSNALTLHRPLRVKQLENGFYSVEGTPTDAVHLALSGLLDVKFDIVVSGVNAGSNLGDDVIYSGTVAAAMEGRFLGLPAIAVSLCGERLKHFDTGARLVKDMLLNLQSGLVPANAILNVNVPDVPYEELAGVEVTRFGTRHSAEPTIKQKDPRGGVIYWVGPPGLEQDAGEGTDFYAIHNKKASITPLNLDWTHHGVCKDVNGWLKTWQ